MKLPITPAGLALLLLAPACGRVEPVEASAPPATPSQPAGVVWVGHDGLGNDVSKMCDVGRAIYVVDGSDYRAGAAVAVVVDAAECVRPIAVGAP